MKSEISYPLHRTSKHLVACLALLAAVANPALRAASADDMQKLEDEVAALKQRLAQYEGPNATAPAASTTATVVAKPAVGTSRLATDDGVTLLTPYEVSSDKDNGYLRTNSATATSNKKSVIISADGRLSNEGNKDAAALELCRKMNWVGNLVKGETSDGTVYVFDDPTARVVNPEVDRVSSTVAEREYNARVSQLGGVK